MSLEVDSDCLLRLDLFVDLSNTRNGVMVAITQVDVMLSVRMFQSSDWISNGHNLSHSKTLSEAQHCPQHNPVPSTTLSPALMNRSHLLMS